MSKHQQLDDVGDKLLAWFLLLGTLFVICFAAVMLQW